MAYWRLAWERWNNKYPKERFKSPESIYIASSRIQNYKEEKGYV